jgi:hypothetical protein
MMRLDWFAFALLLCLFLAVLVAFFLYLRTSHRQGGRRKVRESFIVAVIALLALYVLRVAENTHLGFLKEAVDHMTR